MASCRGETHHSLVPVVEGRTTPPKGCAGIRVTRGYLARSPPARAPGRLAQVQHPLCEDEWTSSAPFYAHLGYGIWRAHILTRDYLEYDLFLKRTAAYLEFAKWALPAHILTGLCFPCRLFALMNFKYLSDDVYVSI